MTPLPLLSIITINLNNKAGLRRTLTSIQNVKKNENLQFIFVDGLSNDGSIELAQKFYLAELMIVERDLGIYNAMNKGWKLANGKYVIWINSGDELISEEVENLIEILNNEDSAIVSLSTLVKLDAASTEFHIAGGTTCKLPEKVLPHQSTVFSKEKIEQYNGYDESFKIVSDRDLILRMYFEGEKISYYDNTISVYYEDGISSRFDTYQEVLKLRRKHKMISLVHYIFASAIFQIRNQWHIRSSKH